FSDLAAPPAGPLAAGWLWERRTSAVFDNAVWEPAALLPAVEYQAPAQTLLLIPDPPVLPVAEVPLAESLAASEAADELLPEIRQGGGTAEVLIGGEGCDIVIGSEGGPVLVGGMAGE